MPNYCILKHKAVLEISGRDRIAFLQPLITNKLENGKIYTLMLSPQGRFLFDFFIYHTTNDTLLIELYDNQLQGLFRCLNMYKLRANVEITDQTSSYLAIYSDDNLGGALAKDSRSDYLKYHGLIHKSNSILLEDKSSKKYCEIQELYSCDKYHYAIPEGVVDLIPDKSLPPEFGLEYLNAISYNKGCYIGQEVISRAKYQGVVRKKIYKVSINEKLNNDKLGSQDTNSSPNLSSISPKISSGTVITTKDASKIGIITSVWQNQGIALIRINDPSNPSPLLNAYINDNIAVTLELAPWYLTS